MLKVPEFHPPLKGIVGEEVSLEYPKFQTEYGVADPEIHYLEHERELLTGKTKEELRDELRELRNKEDYKRIGTTISLEDQKLIDKLEVSRWKTREDERTWEDYTKSELLQILENKEQRLKIINKYGLLKYEEYVAKESYENDPGLKEMVEDDSDGEFDFLKNDIVVIKRILENKEYMFDPDDTDEEEEEVETSIEVEEEDLKKLVEMGYITGVEEGEELELHKGFKMESEDEVEEYVKKYPKFKKARDEEERKIEKAKEEKAKEEKEKAKMPTKEELKEEKKKIRYEKVGEWSLEELEQYKKYKQQVKNLNKEEILARYNKYIKNRKLGLGMAIDWLTNNMKKYREGAPPFYAGGKKRGNILLGILKEIENPL